MKSRFSCLPFACLLMAATASADTFVMKNGDRLDATILKETPDSYVLQVQITKSIRDEKTVAKADVVEIIAEKMDEKAFELIKGLVPVPDLQGNDEYDRRIVAVVGFIKNHPKSPLIPEAEKMLSTLKTEGVVVMGGGMKLGDKLITAEEYKADAYDIDARIIEKRARDAAARGDILGGLRGIDRLETDYKYTDSRRATAPLKQQLLKRYKAQIGEQLTTFDTRTAERNAGLARMTAEARATTEQALAEELETTTRLMASENEKNMRWVTTHPYHKDSLEDAVDEIEDAMTDDIGDNGRNSGKIYRNVVRIIGEQSDHEVIKEVIGQAEEVEIPAKYIDKLKEIAKAKGVQF